MTPAPMTRSSFLRSLAVLPLAAAGIARVLGADSKPKDFEPTFLYSKPTSFPAGSDGWKIRSDGNAEFKSVHIGQRRVGPVQTQDYVELVQRPAGNGFAMFELKREDGTLDLFRVRQNVELADGTPTLVFRDVQLRKPSLHPYIWDLTDVAEFEVEYLDGFRVEAVAYHDDGSIDSVVRSEAPVIRVSWREVTYVPNVAHKL